MKKEKKICQYEDIWTDWKCPHEALEDSKEGFCIFHERRKDKDIERFNEGIKTILEDEKSDAYHFEGFFFPAPISFKGFEFKKDVFFANVEFSGEETEFSLAKFLGEITDFHGAKFSRRNTYFYGAEFSGCTYFDGAEFSLGNTDFADAKFSGEITEFTGAEFSSQSTDFSGIKLSGGNVSFLWVEFLGEKVTFFYPEFLVKVLFDQCIFKAKTSFTGVDLRKCVFKEVDLKNVDFSLLEWNWKYQLGNETELEETLRILEMYAEKEKKHIFYFKTSEIYQQLKVQFHNKRDFAKAGMFHFREQECKRMACKLPQDFFKWIFLWILKLSCGYGEKLRNVGLSSVALVLLFGIIYMFLGLHTTDQNESLLFQYSLNSFITTSLGTVLKDFWTSFIFSIKGFFPLWRFQQYKVGGDFANLIAGIEFLLGAFMVGLFVYVFRRRMEK